MANLTREQRAAREAAQKNEGREDDDRPVQGGADDRIIRDSGSDVRGDRGYEEDPAREVPLTDDELEAMIAAEFDQNRLPTPPKMPGWHLCWLTTTSQYDSIHNRIRIGYQLVRQDELPGFDPSAGQGLERFPGVVTCNEMVLGKIDERRYQAIMRIAHHKKPLEGEEGIINSIHSAARDSSGKKLVHIDKDDDGMTNMEADIKRANGMAPTFS